MQEFLMSIARVTAQIGMELTGQPSRAAPEFNRADLANAIVHSAVEQTCEIVSNLGMVRRLDVERGEFGLIVGVIAREMFNLTEALADTKLSLADSTLDLGETCMQAYLAMRR